MLEILSPAGSPEGVIAAVQNGADAVYLGVGGFAAQTGARNFDWDETGRSLEYCRVRGVKTYLMLNTLAYDDELVQLAEQAKEACRLGIDAIIVHDLGVMMAVRQAAPQVSLHAGMHLGVHNLEGVKMAAAMGFKRAVIAKELSRKKIAYICKYSPIEVEIFVHGEQCIAYCGQCYMSSLSGKSDNRGLCTKPCRLSYNAVGHSMQYPLSIKDNCLIQYLDDLSGLGVAAVNIEGIAKRPEYSAMVTGSYSKVAHKNRFPSQDDLRALQTMFSKQGFTDGYYTDILDAEMLGMREEEKKADAVMLSTARKNYLNGEYQRVPVRFLVAVAKDKRVKIAAGDDRRNSALLYGPVPEPAFHKELTLTALQTQFHKTSGTPFICVGVKGTVEPDLILPLAVWEDIRRKLLADIVEQRKAISQRAEGEYAPTEHVEGSEEPLMLSISVARIEQLSMEMANLDPDIVYIPVTEIPDDSPILKAMLENANTNVSAALPQVIHDNERKNLSEMLHKAKSMGITDVLVGNIGHIQFARSHGMNVRGDFSLNAFNSQTLEALRILGLVSVALSFELSLEKMRELSKPIDTELIAYGRLPLMLTQTCIVKNCTGACTCESFSGLVDEQGSVLPVLPEFGCRNTLLSAKKLFMADKRRDLAALGVRALRLMFTTENANECLAVMQRFMGLSDHTPSGYMRGLYYRGVV